VQTDVFVRFMPDASLCPVRSRTPVHES